MSISEIKDKAGKKLKGNWWKMALIMFVFLLVSERFGLEKINYATRTLAFDTSLKFIGKNGVLSFNVPTGSGWIFRILLLLISMFALVIRSGGIKSCIRVMRGEKPHLSDLLLRGVFWKMLWMNIIRMLITGFFTMLLIVPGVIVSLAYSMADYLLIENPEMGPIEALRESRRRMKGNKGRLFGLGLSFFGWIVLAVIAARLVSSPLRFIPVLQTMPVLNIFIACISAAVNAMLFAYMFTANTAFHMHINGEEI